jgi:hypothetical protein
MKAQGHAHFASESHVETAKKAAETHVEPAKKDASKN